MSKKLIVIILTITAAILGLFLWRVVLWKPIDSMDIFLIWGGPITADTHVGNNSVSFGVNVRSERNFTISIENNGTVPLEGVTLYIDEISSGLSFVGFDEPLHAPSSKFLGALEKKESIAYGWTVISPSESGNYEVDFRVVSDKIMYWFSVVINVT